MAARQRTRNGARDMQVNNILAGEYEATRIDLLEYFTTRYRRPTLLKLVAENPRNEERVSYGQLLIYFAFVNFGSIEANHAAFQAINNEIFRNLPLRVHINRELEDGTPITTDIRLARRIEANEHEHQARQIEANCSKPWLLRQQTPQMRLCWKEQRLARQHEPRQLLSHICPRHKSRVR
jgi:hypothetical protein